MPRKENKLRPYRVDYFDIGEMENDKALVRSVVIRAVDAQIARNMVVYNDPTASGHGTFGEDRIIIRAYRYYKNLVHKRDVYKAVEDLFSVNRAVEVMEYVEKYRREKIDAQFKAAAGKMPADPLAEKFSSPETPEPTATMVVATPQVPEMTKEEAGTGLESPATVAVVTDLQGMIAHDEHEKIMETFQPSPEHGDDIATAVAVVPDFSMDWSCHHSVLTRGCPRCDAKKIVNDMIAAPVEEMTSQTPPKPSPSEDLPLPLWIKGMIFGGITLLVAILVIVAIQYN